MKSILITGGCGFIGHHLVEHVFRNTDWNIIIIDNLTYASRGLERLRNAEILPKNSLSTDRLKILLLNLCTELSVELAKELGKIDYIIHMAADTHVDSSIINPVQTVKNNVISTLNILEFSRKIKPEIFLYFSTDEVYGSAEEDKYFSENDAHNPSNPYSASKSAAEQICNSYKVTYNIPLMIVNVMNAFGERQHVEKFIPKVIKALLNSENIEIHTDSKGKIGSRSYIHARNISAAVMFLLEKGKIGEKYNIVGEKEMNNLELAEFIADVLEIPLKYTLVSDIKERPGHDIRYALNGQKMADMGWVLPKTFEESLEKTILWTLNNKEWLDWN